MKLIVLATVSLTIIGSLLFANGAGATTVENNRGSIVKVSGSCEDALISASNNRGSIIKIDGNHTCTVDELIGDGSVVENNRGSIIKIENVCGDASKIEAVNNRGSIIKVSSSTSCISGKPTTVVVEQPKSELPASQNDTDLPAELPRTGSELIVLEAGLAGLFGYGLTSVIRRRA